MNGTVTVQGQKIELFNNNLCQEVMLTGQQQLPCTLAYYYPGTKINAAFNRLPKNPYKFSRANWYVAEFDWVHTREVLEWCYYQFGPHPRNPDAWSRWYNNYGEKIHFRDEKDYEWFVLRWGA